MNETLKNNKIYQGIITALCVLFTVFLMMTQVYPFSVNLQLGLPLGLGTLIAFLTRKSKSWAGTVAGWGLALGMITAVWYVIWFQNDVSSRIGRESTMDIAMAMIGTLVLLSIVRIKLGRPLFIINIVALLFAYFGHLLPTIIAHKGFTINRIFRYMWLGQEGIFGTVMSTFVGTIFPFLLMGTIMQITGMGQALIEVAYIATKKLTGGIGYAAVLACSLFGAISGSAPANAAATGTFTIPAMKAQGYSDKLSASVVAVASAGGQIMPPVMGAAAFIMAETLGVPYAEIVFAAIVPALLYYFGVAEYVSIESIKIADKTKDVEMDIAPKLARRAVLMAIPFAILIAMLILNYSAGICGVYACFAALAVSFLEPSWRMDLKGMIHMLRDAALDSIGLLLTCGVVGILIGIITMTGFGVKFGNLVILASGGQLLIALLLVMLASIVMGMGMPTVACYVILASTCASVLVNMGMTTMAAHMFVFYFGIMSAITPPVALASFTAAGIAGSNINETGWLAFKMALPAFLIPYAFAMDNALLLDGTMIQIVWAIFVTVLGVTTFVAGLGGIFIRGLRLRERIVFLVAGVLLIIPLGRTDLIGLVICVVMLPYLIATKKTVSVKSVKAG